MNKIELKPCPFCGRTDTLIIHEVSERLDDTDIKQYTVICNTSGDNAGCGANCGYRHFTKQDAIAAWNKRVEKTGRWINIRPLLTATRCSECKRAFAEKTNFCPYCGAKMKGEKMAEWRIDISGVVNRVVEQLKSDGFMVVKHGKWEHNRCTECGKSLDDLFSGDFYYDEEELKYCPNCGAKMEGKRNERVDRA